MIVEQDMIVPTSVGLAPCNLKVISVDDKKVVLRDLCSGMSITNAAEHVVERVDAEYPNRRIFYYDSMGQYDELVHVQGKFQAFAPGGESS